MGGVADSLGGFLGTSDGPNQQARTQNGALDALSKQLLVNNNGNLNDLSRNFQDGSMSLGDALNSAKSQVDPQQYNLFASNLATDPMSGSKVATDQVQNNAIQKQLFGQGGALSSALSEDKNLASQGFQLQPEDREAYGQVSGDIARQFGSSENDLASALASRGLGGGQSGAAGMSYSGLMGNKNEQLAKAQMQIAQTRMQTTMQRRAQTQSYINALSGQANSAIQNQFGRQQTGANDAYSHLQDLAQLDTQANSEANKANLAAAQFNTDNKPQNIWDMAQGGLGTAIGAGGKTAGQKAGNSLVSGGGGATTPPPGAMAMA